MGRETCRDRIQRTADGRPGPGALCLSPEHGKVLRQAIGGGQRAGGYHLAPASTGHLLAQPCSARAAKWPIQGQRAVRRPRHEAGQGFCAVLSGERARAGGECSELSRGQRGRLFLALVGPPGRGEPRRDRGQGCVFRARHLGQHARRQASSGPEGGKIRPGQPEPR